MKERVFIRRSKLPVLLVAPHGNSDSHTITLTKHVANIIDCNAVINQGFERSDHVDVVHDLADCNRIDHIQEEVVFDEFLKPIIAIRDTYRKRNRFLKASREMSQEALLIIYIHGAGNSVHKEVNEQVAAIVGYGLGHTVDSITCQPWRVNLFIDIMRQIMRQCMSGEVYEGRGGGKYAARQSNNLVQYFRKHNHDTLVDSIQVEFPFSMRKSEGVAKNTGELLALVVEEILKHTSYYKFPAHKFI